MRIASLLLLMISTAFAAQPLRQEKPANAATAAPTTAADVKSIDAIISALYDVISGPAGERNWQRFRALFAPHAVLATVSKRNGEIRPEIMTPDDYVRLAGEYFAKNGFFESESARNTQTYGSVAHLFSTYESRHTREGAPFAKGINSIELLNDGQRWWVLSISWDEERPDNPIPPEYRPKK